MIYGLFDVETSGLGPKARILEIAILFVKDNTIVDEYTTLVNPGYDTWLDPKAVAIHGITWEALRDSNKSYDVFRTISNKIKGIKMVAHNSSFDMRMLKREFDYIGLPLYNESIDTIPLCKKRWTSLENYKLETVYKHVTGDLPVTAHRALEDTKMLFEIWKAL